MQIQESNTYREENAGLHAFFAKEVNKETFMIRLQSANNRPLAANQKCYLDSNVTRPVRHVTSLGCDVGGTIDTLTTYNGMQIIPVTTLKCFGITLVGTDGKYILNNYPLGALIYRPFTLAGFPAYNLKGKTRRFDMVIDLHRSFLTYFGLATFSSTNFCAMLTFGFK